MLTVRDVLGMPRLDTALLAGESGLGREVRWAHVIELADPVPWLRGGELVLTVGLGLPSSGTARAEYVRALAEAGCAGLGFAAELLEELPAEVLATAEECALPVIAVLGTTPFIAVSEAVAHWHAEHERRIEQRAIATQQSIARARLRSGTEGLLAELARSVHGEVLLLDRSGRAGSAHPAGSRAWHPRASELIEGLSKGGQAATGLEYADRSLVVHSIGLSGPPRGWLAVDCPVSESRQQRLLTGHAAVLLTMDALGVRSVRERWHEQRARLLSAILRGTEPPPDAAEVLPEPPFEVLALRPRAVAEVLDALSTVLGDPELEQRCLIAESASGVSLLVPELEPRIGPRLLEQFTGNTAIGAASARGIPAVAGALRRAERSMPDSGYAHADDTDPWALLRRALPESAAEGFTQAVAGELYAHDARNGTELARSTLTYLDAAENLELAAKRLGVHRNTLRARLATAQRISGLSLDDPTQRLTLWLALAGDGLLGGG